MHVMCAGIDVMSTAARINIKMLPVGVGVWQPRQPPARLQIENNVADYTCASKRRVGH